MYYPTHMKCPQVANLQEQKADEWLPKAGERKRMGERLLQSYGLSFWAADIDLELGVLLVAPHCECTKCHSG